MIRLDTQAADQNSRLALIIFNLSTMRQMELWREAMTSILGRIPDAEDVLIIAAIQATGGEKLLSAAEQASFRNLSTDIPYDILTSCNVLSIAAWTGINRETVRRRSNRMIEEGLLVKNNGSLHVSDAVMRSPVAREAVHKQLSSLRSTLHRLQAIGVLIETG